MTGTGVRDPEDPQRWLVAPWPADASFRAVLQHFHQVSSTRLTAGTSGARLVAFHEGFCSALAAAPTGKFTDQTDEDRRRYIRSCADLAVRIVQDLDVAEYGHDPQTGEDQHVREWAVLRIPDLLYTPDYTRALFQADRVFCADHFVGGRWDDAGARRILDEIQSRQHRQDRLIDHTDQPVDYTVVIEEAALRKVVGDRSIMRAQLSELLDFAGATAVHKRLIPPGLGGGLPDGWQIRRSRA